MEIISEKSDLPMDFVTWDLSPQGAYLMTDAVPKAGLQIVCSFSLGKEARSYCFFAEISRTNKGRRDKDTGPIGFGISFIDPTPLERLQIRGLLRGQKTSRTSSLTIRKRFQ